jgi:CRISPR-associated protein Csx17
MPQVFLEGCRPEPLMNYLKAIGVLRLVAEQADAEARGCWRNDVFLLCSKLDRNALCEFFLNQYKPTPIVAPWGARSGFYAGSSEKAARGAIEEVMKSKDLRFAPFQDLVKRVRSLLQGMGISEKAKDEEKMALLAGCRSRLPDEIMPWLDTCYVLLGDDRRFPPLLGTGGNEGSGSYVSGFAQQIVACLIKRNHDSALCSALFGDSRPDSFTDQTPGHFSGMAAGGANAGQGFDASVRTNPWDYLLCLEGTCLWASGVVRRLGQLGPRMASFPFTVTVSGVGSASLTLSDGVKPKKAKRDIAEIWLPIWSRSLALPELRGLLAEGRVTVGRRTAVAGIDVARAIAGLGVDRGISRFERNIFLMRNGQSFLAVSAGSMNVEKREAVDLILGIDPWLNRFREASAHKDAPPRFKAALRDVEQAIFEFCRYGGPGFFQAILVALGQAERELAVNEGRVTNKQSCNPLAPLSSDWIDAASDGTPEFELALALAGVFDLEQKIGSLRTNLEPVALQRRKDGNRSASWAEKGRSVVWNSASLAVNLTQVLARRIMDGDKEGCENLPLAADNFVSLSTVSQFLAGELDDRRIEELLWGLVLVDQERRPDKASPPSGWSGPLPRAYALLKLLFLPEPLKVGDQEILIKPEPRVLALLSAGRVGEACQIAMRRLRASGLSPLPHPRSGGVVRDRDWKELDCLGADGQRLAAALLMPISKDSIRQLQRLVTRGPENEDSMR